jgi:DNA-binding Lrp family transcriptional regulator
MKVTKTIREFIEDKVAEKLRQTMNIAELESKAKEETENFTAELSQLFEKYGITGCNRDYYTKHYLKAVREYNEAYEKLRIKKNSIVRRIAAEMELGGSKEELMEKLDNLKF